MLYLKHESKIWIYTIYQDLKDYANNKMPWAKY